MIGECRNVVYLSRIFRPEDWPRFIESRAFERKWSRLGLTDGDLALVQKMIMSDPKRAPVVRGTGGMRKLRFGDRKSGRGKSGAFRVYYAYFPTYGIVFLATVFGKNEADDLSDADKVALTSLVEIVEAQLGSGMIQ